MRREEPQTDEPLLVDELSERLDRFRILYDRDDAATDELLAELGGQGKVEREMLRQLAATRVLASPDRVPEAHAVTMRALEVLSRNGSRPPSSLRPLGPLTRIARYLVQQVIRYVVRRHQHQVVEALRDLYSRRLGWVPPGDPARSVLLRARLDVERSAPAYKKNAIGVPAFLLGGAVVSSVSQGLRRSAAAAAGSRVGVNRRDHQRLRPDRRLVVGHSPRGGHRPAPHQVEPGSASRRPVGDDRLVRATASGHLQPDGCSGHRPHRGRLAADPPRIGSGVRPLLNAILQTFRFERGGR